MVGIVILNYNNVKDTVNCIDTVVKYTKSDYKIVLIDNGSSKEDVVQQLHKNMYERFEKSFVTFKDGEKPENNKLSQLTFITSATNDGYARGNNKGIKLLLDDSDVDKIMILNNDILFTQDVITPLIDIIDSLHDAAIVSPLLFKRDGITIDYTCARYNAKRTHEFIKHLFFFLNWIGRKMDKKTNIIRFHPEYMNLPYFEVELPSGSCMLLKKELVKKIGMFDPGTFLYCEENIIYEQIKKLGLKNYIIPSLSCIHLGGSTTKQESVNIKALRFIRKCGIDSMNYYLTNYTDASKAYIYFTKTFSLMNLQIEILKGYLKNIYHSLIKSR